MMNILHIAAHLGGGAGKAISGIAIQGQQLFSDTHRILLLQQPEKDGYVKECDAQGIEIQLWTGDYELLRWADVIVVSWWNHPAMAAFLQELRRISAPLLLWSHINGCHYPILPYDFASAFDGIMITSPYTLQNPHWRVSERQAIQAEIVWGIGRFAPENIPVKTGYQNKDIFTIGYVGTLGYGKIHPRFVEYCNAVCHAVPEARFVLAGDPDAALARDLSAAGLSGRIEFTGYVSDVPALMCSFDAFGYILNPEHYGTTENTILEAMACGIPVVAALQGAERFIVPASAGVLVSSPEDYAVQMAFLWKHPALREQLGRGARAHVLQKYRSAENTTRFRGCCCRAMESTRKKHDFSNMGDTPWEWFLFCLDSGNRQRMETLRQALEAGDSSAGALLEHCPPILWEDRKSSLRHFADVYPNDRTLRMIREKMEVYQWQK